MKISPTSLVSMCKIQKNFYSEMRLVGLILTYIEKNNKSAAIYEKGLYGRSWNICFNNMIKYGSNDQTQFRTFYSFLIALNYMSDFQ